MIKVLEKKPDNLISTIVTAEFTMEDFYDLTLALEAKAGNANRIRWYLELEDIHNSLPKYFSGLKENLDRDDLFEKIAVVGDRIVHQWSSQLQEQFPDAEVRFFLTSDQQEAHKWIGR
jgi:hypothetical protein